jgi:hypothetical protein
MMVRSIKAVTLLTLSIVGARAQSTVSLFLYDTDLQSLVGSIAGAVSIS